MSRWYSTLTTADFTVRRPDELSESHCRFESSFSFVVTSGVGMRLLDHEEYPTVWRGMWWALQTVTTVGYGDVTPMRTSGRAVAAFVMLEGIAFVAILVAAITSTFVARANRESGQADTEHEQSDEEQLNARFDDLVARLDRVEGMLSRLTSS